MDKKRIIPCLDIKDGRVVKGVNFVDLKDAGDPIEIAKAYSEAGADELVLLDVSATNEKRLTTIELVQKIVNSISIPLTVGGGIATADDCRMVLNAGANKVSISTAALMNPSLISELVSEFGSESVVVAIDAKARESKTGWDVYKNGGRVNTNMDLIEWASHVYKLGAGEILLTSMDGDGSKSGYDLELTKAVAESVLIPVIASGGAGSMEDFYDALTVGQASGALAATLFHYNEIKVKELKRYLHNRGVNVGV